jgi:biopolymer transport protein ExbB
LLGGLFTLQVSMIPKSIIERMMRPRPSNSVFTLLAAIALELTLQSSLLAQQPIDANEIAVLQQAAQNPTPEVVSQPRGIDALNLMMQGGWVMIPLALVSLGVVMWSLERLFSLRSGRVMPRGLVRPLTQMIRQSDVLPVREAYDLCNRNPSVAANVIATTLIRTGRPLPEIERTASDAIQREVDAATGPVRWLAFLAGIAPLLGLLGTVWGLIRAFHDTTQLDPTQNRAEALATGIYEALVTTLAGLIIAIPAAALAHYFENRIIRTFRRIEELVALLLPRLEGYENKVRFDPIGSDIVPRDIQPIPPRVEPKEPKAARSTLAPSVSTLQIDATKPAEATRRTSALKPDRSTLKKPPT